MINTQNIAELSEKVAALEAAIKTAGIELPTVTTDDNGKTLQVVAGKWDKGMKIPELPAVTASDNGKALEVVNGAWNTGSNHINPPDLSNISRTALTNGESTEITSDGKWYCVVTVNGSDSGACAGFIYDSTNTNILSGSGASSAGANFRYTTAWLYFPAGAKFYARGLFTDSTLSGLFSASPL